MSDTLPTGLNFVTGTGTGWNCLAVGQVVTCTNAGPIAANATSTITLTVSVAAAAVPSVINVAVVAGGADGNPGNNTASDLTVIRQPPTLTVSLSPSELWPPNHELIPVTATITVRGDFGPNPRVVLVSIVSNEADDGLGDGDTANDIQGAVVGTDDRSFLLRAERSGKGSGRVYTVTYRATDAAGNMSTVSAVVVVPKDQGRR